MKTTHNDVQTCKLLQAGRWIDAKTADFEPVINPSDGSIIAKTPMCGPREVDETVRAAQTAFETWSEAPIVERARVFFRYRRLLEEHTDELAAIISREHGKTRAEARASVLRGIEVVEFACGIPSLIGGQTMENIARDVDCETLRRPLGVCVGITPFNFPAMVPLWMFPVAIVCGNAFVLKPSEKVPLSANRLGELLVEAGLPDGVFSIVHGGKACVDALLGHDLVRSVSFVGSTPVAKYIYETGTANGKRVQAAGGAKNHIVIMPDADLEQTVAALQNAAFGCAGERCMAGSIAVPVGDIAQPLVDGLCAASSKLRVGRTDGDAQVDMGPLITRAHRDRVREYLDIGRAEGAELVLDGSKVSVEDGPEGFFIGPSVFDRVQPEMRVARDEIFGPVLSVIRVATVDEAIALGHDCPYGNGAAIFTRSGYAARRFKREFNAGMIGINVAVPAPMAWFPFTGQNRSFFGDLHIQGMESVHFYTQQRVTMTRWFEGDGREFHDPIWSDRRG